MEALSRLTPTQFENVSYDILQAAGMHNLVWRTPGSDGGRDIEGVFPSIDFSGARHVQIWYIECKLYSSSIDWPTLWKKISYADSRGADFLLLITNNNPSPQCESEIVNWNNQGNRLVVRVWRGYELEHIVRSYPLVAAKYGLLEATASALPSAQVLISEIMKSAQTSYASYSFGENIEKSLEANAALCELVAMRLDQIAGYGRFVPAGLSATAPAFPWLTWTGNVDRWEEAGLRAFLCMLRYTTWSDHLRVHSLADCTRIECCGQRFTLDPSVLKIVRSVALWANIEVRRVDGKFVEIGCLKKEELCDV